MAPKLVDVHGDVLPWSLLDRIVGTGADRHSGIGPALDQFSASDAMNTDRSTEGSGNPLEIVGIARDDEIPAGERPGDDGCVNDVASAGPRAREAGGTSAVLVEILDSAAA